MRTYIKYRLSHLGIFPYLDLLRRLPEIMGWIGQGCTGAAPPPLKRMILSIHLRRFALHQFIETGTYVGDMLAYIANDKSVACTSIELAEEYYRAAIQRFSSYQNVSLLHGDSGILLPQLVRDLKAPALFWLDAHYSGGATARGEADTPVSVELQAILDSPIKRHVVLIDDARCFNGTNAYPHLDELICAVREDGFYDSEVSVDIIRLSPKKGPSAAPEAEGFH